MAKYHELLETYKEDIERIRDAKRAYEEARDELNQFSQNQDHNNYDYAEEARLAEIVDDAQSAYYHLSQILTQEVEVEYHDVPFEKTRKQGMEKFFELANI